MPRDDPRQARRRARLGLVVAGGVVVAGGIAVGLVELLQWPKGSVWFVAGATTLLAGLIRALTSRPR